jgi:N-acetylglucosaminyldiphosphoundecaprenol N-acetyl-beta-D-mannosaminyltransferase
MTRATDAFGLGALVAPPASRVDFGRPLTCVLGLPVDAIDLAEAVKIIRKAAFSNTRCFVSTPNLNFALTARTNAAFRGSVVRSDLSLVDGMPLVLVGWLMGLSLPERVSGADVFEALLAHQGPPINVYFFGGPPGTGALACDEINRRGGGVRCVGFDNAGFGSIESMSSDEQIARINASGAHFVVAALGAVKGQAWIEHNAKRLVTPVLAHLGAVVNFAAGTVTRAPQWVQSCGLEWLWRIKEEPQLWRRYWNDGVGFVGLLATRVLPEAMAGVRWRIAGSMPESPAHFEVVRNSGGHLVRLKGDWRAEQTMESLREALTCCACDNRRLTLDIGGVTALGASVTALLLVAHGWFSANGSIELVGVTREIAASLHQKLAADELLGADR